MDAARPLLAPTLQRLGQQPPQPPPHACWAIGACWTAVCLNELSPVSRVVLLKDPHNRFRSLLVPLPPPPPRFGIKKHSPCEAGARSTSAASRRRFIGSL